MLAKGRGAADQPEDTDERIHVAVRGADRHRFGSDRAGARPDQYDAGWLAEHVAEVDAPARDSAVRRHRRGHDNDLADGALERQQRRRYRLGTARIYFSALGFFGAGF